MDTHGGEQPGRSPRVGLVLPGGGARGAYQVGVLSAIADMVPDNVNPFPVITGTSVGAINAASIASRADNFKLAVRRLTKMWCQLRTDNIYRTDPLTIMRCSLRWLASLTLGGLGVANPESFLDNEPLRELLNGDLDLSQIEKAIEAGALRAVAVTASSYNRGRAVSFFQGEEGIGGWERARRDGLRQELTVDHLLASSSLPFIFPAQRIGKEFYGDGSLRLTAPLSPAIRLGAERVLVLGIRDAKPDELPNDAPMPEPTLGDLGGYMVDLIFMENLTADIERLTRINSTLSLLDAKQEKQTRLRPIEIMTLLPSEDLRTIAGRHAYEMPRTIRTLLRGIGAWHEGWRLVSYLLFEPPYIGELVALGYRDAMDQREALLAFLQPQTDAHAPGKVRQTAAAK